ncbi:MAG: hypothetical protein ACU0CT_02720 [Paracoccaceae bacterium]
MRLHQRLKALEDKTPVSNQGPTVLIIQSVAPTPDGPADGVPVAAFILSSETLPGVSLRRDDEEAEADFLSRVEVERFRIHGTEAAT